MSGSKSEIELIDLDSDTQSESENDIEIISDDSNTKESTVSTSETAPDHNQAVPSEAQLGDAKDKSSSDSQDSPKDLFIDLDQGDDLTAEECDGINSKSAKCAEPDAPLGQNKVSTSQTPVSAQTKKGKCAVRQSASLPQKRKADDVNSSKAEANSSSAAKKKKKATQNGSTHYAKPQMRFLNLVVLVLRNASCVSYNDLWNFISGIFPYFENTNSTSQGLKKIRGIIKSNSVHFLINNLGTASKTNESLVMLNPVMRELHDSMATCLPDKKQHFQRCLFKPEHCEPLFNGSHNITAEDLCHSRIKNVLTSQKQQQVIKVQILSAIDSNPQSLAEGTQTASEMTEETKTSGEQSPSSDNSTDTMVFDPKIIDCRTLTGAEVEFMSVEENNADDVMSQLTNAVFDQNCNRSYVNTVWSCSTDCQSSTGFVGNSNTEINSQSKDSKNKQEMESFPEVEHCIPKWRRIFPWTTWISEKRILSCSICQSIIDKTGENKHDSVVVKEVNHPDEIFSVARSLREHADTRMHNMASILCRKDIISTLHFLLSYHFAEFKSTDDILSAFENLMGENKCISIDCLRDSITMLGVYLEERIIECLCMASKFSVITDPCSGILIVKLLNNKDEPEEHVISSYMSVQDKTPFQYLEGLGVDLDKMVAYITNPRCEECSKCKMTETVPFKSNTPLRLPQLDRYIVFLWRTKLLKPFYSLGCTLTKLWLNFPHKFSEFLDHNFLSRISKFSSSPEVLLDIFKNLEKFKGIASTIYKFTGSLEALGLVYLDISKLSKILDIFPILSSINRKLMQIKCDSTFTGNFEKLLLKKDELAKFCELIKTMIKSKAVPDLESCNVDEVFTLVDLTIKEFQNPIYHKGKCFLKAYGRCSSYSYLSEYANTTEVQSDCNILCNALLPSFRHDSVTLHKALLNFLKQHNNLEKKDACTILNHFQNTQSMKEDHRIVLEYYKHIALFAFEMTKNERCLYEIKVYDFLFYRYAWSHIGANIKQHVLTIISELSCNKKLAEKDLYLWWYECSKEKILKSLLP